MFILVHVLKRDGELLPKVVNSDHIHTFMPVNTNGARALIKLCPDDAAESVSTERPLFVQESFEELCAVLCAQLVPSAPTPRRSRRRRSRD